MIICMPSIVDNHIDFIQNKMYNSATSLSYHTIIALFYSRHAGTIRWLAKRVWSKRRHS